LGLILENFPPKDSPQYVCHAFLVIKYVQTYMEVDVAKIMHGVTDVMKFGCFSMSSFYKYHFVY